MQFEYAWCLVRSKYSADISKGVILLEELFETHPEGKRDYLYYLIIGYARLKQSNKALKYCSAFLSVEPGKKYFGYYQNAESTHFWTKESY